MHWRLCVCLKFQTMLGPLNPWSWMFCVPLKCKETLSQQYSVVSQETCIVNDWCFESITFIEQHTALPTGLSLWIFLTGQQIISQHFTVQMAIKSWAGLTIWRRAITDRQSLIWNCRITQKYLWQKRKMDSERGGHARIQHFVSNC